MKRPQVLSTSLLLRVFHFEFSFLGHEKVCRSSKWKKVTNNGKSAIQASLQLAGRNRLCTILNYGFDRDHLLAISQVYVKIDRSLGILFGRACQCSPVGIDLSYVRYVGFVRPEVTSSPSTNKRCLEPCLLILRNGWNSLLSRAGAIFANGSNVGIEGQTGFWDNSAGINGGHSAVALRLLCDTESDAGGEPYSLLKCATGAQLYVVSFTLSLHNYDASACRP